MLLQIVVAPGCRGCEEALRLGDAVRRWFPTLAVEVIEIGGAQPVPSAVFATPTHLLEGKIFSLGNPRPARLCAELRRRLASASPEATVRRSG